MNKLGKVAAVAVSATALVAVAGSPASAASTAQNSRTVYLTDHPTDDMADACVTRTIALQSGRYTWRQFSGVTMYRDITLAAGTYTWTDCVKPGAGKYDHVSTLDKAGTSPAQMSYGFTIADPGWVTFGSQLDPHF